MNVQTIIHPLGITLLAELIVTIAVTIGYLISNNTHMDTVSWNG